MEQNNKKTYWPHMILGFLFIGITLGYWTVKSAIQMPVQEVNKYMMKYQQADMNINEIIERKLLFDKKYTIEIIDTETILYELENAKRAKDEKAILLHTGHSTLNYQIRKKDGSIISDAKVSFLLTRPHTRNEDVFIENVIASNGNYTINDINITKAGRYTLELKVTINDAIGYSQLPAYVKKKN